MKRRNAEVRSRRPASVAPSGSHAAPSEPTGNAILKPMAGSLAEDAGEAAGLARGGGHLAQGVARQP
jgi:hypothetical protein